MTVPSKTGSTLYFATSSKNNNFGSQTVPVDADIALLMISYLEPNAPNPSTMTLNGSSFTTIVNSNDDTNEVSSIHYLVNPTSGIFTVNWSNAPNEGAHIFLVFLKDVDIASPITGFGSAVGTSNPLVSSSFNSSDNDLCFCVGSGSGVSSGDAGVSGQTEDYDGGTFNSAYGLIGYKTGVNGTTTMSIQWGTPINGNSICAVSIAGTLTATDLTANNIVTGNPVLGTPSIGQIHDLTANNIITGNPVLGTTTIGQTHELDANGILIGSPILGSPTIDPPQGISPVVLTSGAAATNGSSTATILPTETPVILVVATAGGIGTHIPTIAGLGLTWTQVDTINYASRRTLTIFTGTGTPTQGSITISPTGGDSYLGLAWVVLESGYIDSIGTPYKNAGAGINATVTINGIPGANDISFAATGFEDDTNLTWEVGWDELDEVSQSSDVRRLSVAWDIDQDNTPSVSNGIADDWGIIAFYIIGVTDSGDNLSADDIITGTPVVGSTSIGQTHDLNSSDILSGNPVVVSPTIEQTHILSSTNIETGNPTLGIPDLTESHGLTSTDILTGTPSIGSPSIGQTHELDPVSITTGIPILEESIIGQTHELIGDDILTQNPVLGLPSITESHGLTANSIETLEPVLGTPGINQTHLLYSTEIVTDLPVVGESTIGQTHELDTIGIITQNPILGTPSLEEVTGMVPLEIVTGNPILGNPTFSQTHVLDSNNIETEIPVLGTPTLAEIGTMVPNDILTGVPILGTPTLTEIHSLDAVDVLTGIPILENPILSPIFAFTAVSIVTETPSIGIPIFSQLHILEAVQLLTGQPIIGSPVISETVDITGIGYAEVIYSERIRTFESDPIRTIFSDRIKTIIKE